MPSRRRPRRSQTAVERRAERAEISDPSLVLEAALRFLEARQRSAAEVRRRLLIHGYRQDLVEGAIDRLLELGMLDDAAFAQAWVESRDRARPRGERALRRELGLKGVDRAVVDDVLADRVDRAEALAGDAAAAGHAADTGRAADDSAVREMSADPDTEAAYRLIARHARALERVADPRARRQKAYALLARNGFDADVCREVAMTVAGPPGGLSSTSGRSAPGMRCAPATRLNRRHAAP